MTTYLLGLAVAVAALLCVRQAVHMVVLRSQWRIGALSKVLPGWRSKNPDGSWVNAIGCGRCGTSWVYVPGHATPYRGLRGQTAIAPLCQRCWVELGTPAERSPFYVAEIEMRRANGERFGHDDRAAILASVAVGL